MNNVEKEEIKRVPFSDLVKLVRHSTMGEHLEMVSTSGEHIKIPERSDEPFVAPDFHTAERDMDPMARVLLISAPAAVGKSSLAAQLARDTGDLVWDLSRFSVGSHFFTGTLVDTYGSSGLEAVRKALQEGKATLILDAADEALVRAGSSNFQAAIENLVTLIGESSKPGPAVVILGRPDTIEDTKQFLSDHGVRTQDARVAFFNENQARSFVKAKAKSSGKQGVAAAELDTFLGRFFEIVGEALGSGPWESSESFLGYAPVLDALGAFYKDETNPMRRLNEINKNLSSAHVWDLLIEIIESVLDRETEKFADSFGGSIERKRRFGGEAYTRQNQLALLLSDLPDEVEIDAPLDDGAEDSWLFDELMPQVRAQYREHPFLNGVDDEPNPLLRFASAAFRDYALAASISTDLRPETARLLDYWGDPRVTPSPMLSRFCMSEPLNLNRVSPDAITMMSDSHASGFQAHVRLEVEVHDGEDGVNGGAVVEVTMLEGHLTVRQLSGTLEDGEPLRLARSVARTTIYSPHRTLVTGSGFPDFSIGPDVSIRCKRLDSESSGVRVRVEEGQLNEISTERILGSTRRVQSPRTDGLRIDVPVAGFPWQNYKSPTTEDSADGESAIYWAGMEMRRITKWYVRESMAGGLNYMVEPMESILAKGRASTQAHQFCLMKGVLRKKGNSWEMQLPGFGPSTVMENDISDETYRAFLAEFVAWMRK